MSEIMEFAGRKPAYTPPELQELAVRSFAADDTSAEGGIPGQGGYDDPFASLFMPNTFNS